MEVTTTTGVRGVHHVTVSVADLDRAVAFYESATRLQVDTWAPVNPDDEARRGAGYTATPRRGAVLRGPNAHVELLEFDADDRPAATVVPVEGPGVTHICFQSPAADEGFRRMQASGATTVTTGTEPIDLGGYGVRYGYARDFDQTMFEVEQLDDPPFDGPIWIAHVALVSPDIDRLVAFYADVLGEAPYRRVDEVRGRRADAVTGIDDVAMRAAWFGTGNMVVELWQYLHPVTPEPGPPAPPEALGYASFSFEVDDIAAEYARLAALGVEWLTDPVAGDGIIEAYARDPDGNLFSILELAAESPASLTQLAARTW